MVIKLGAAVQTSGDFEELGLMFGVNVTVSSGTDYAVLPYPVPFAVIGTPPLSSFTTVVNVPLLAGVLPYDIPFTVGDRNSGQLKCFFTKLKQANGIMIFIETI